MISGQMCVGRTIQQIRCQKDFLNRLTHTAPWRKEVCDFNHGLTISDNSRLGTQSRTACILYLFVRYLFCTPKVSLETDRFPPARFGGLFIAYSPARARTPVGREARAPLGDFKINTTFTLPVSPRRELFLLYL
jgi:hypothetical protein